MHALIKGAGIIGLSIGWRLLREGFSVELFDRGKAGRGASFAAAGLLWPLCRSAFRRRGTHPIMRAELKLVPSVSKRALGRFWASDHHGKARELLSSALTGKIRSSLNSSMWKNKKKDSLPYGSRRKKHARSNRFSLRASPLRYGCPPNGTSTTDG